MAQIFLSWRKKSATQQKKLQFEVNNDINELVLNSWNFALNKWAKTKKLLQQQATLNQLIEGFGFITIHYNRTSNKKLDFRFF